VIHFAIQVAIVVVSFVIDLALGAFHLIGLAP